MTTPENWTPVVTTTPRPTPPGGSTAKPPDGRQMLAAGELGKETIIGTVAIAFAGVQVLGVKPFAALRAWGEDRIADAQAAFAKAQLANSANNPAIVDVDGRLSVLENPGGGNSWLDGMDRASLGSDWNLLSGSVSMASSDYVKGAGSAPAVLVYTAQTFASAQHYAQVRLRKLDYGGAGLQIMSSTDMQSGVMVSVSRGSFQDTVRIYSVIGGSSTQRESKTARFDTNDVLGLGYNPGTATYVVYVNNEVFDSWTDVASVVPTTGAYRSMGLRLNTNFPDTGARGCGLDNIAAYDWNGSGTSALGEEIYPEAARFSMSAPTPVLDSRDAYLPDPGQIHWHALNPTIDTSFAAFSLENTDVAAQPVPVGASGCWLTMLGPGGKAGNGRLHDPYNDGGAGSGGGARIGRSFIPVSAMGSTYTLTRGTTPGVASVFMSGPIDIRAGSGGNGANGVDSSNAGGAGGVASVFGTDGVIAANGSPGGRGGAYTSASQAGVSNTAGAGSGGGGGSDNYSAGKLGGTTTGGTPSGLAGAGGKGGAGSLNQSNPGLPGTGYGSGAGGGGGRRSGVSGSGGTGPNGQPGYTLIEWV